MKSYVRSVEDFPKPGITYRDITPLLADPEIFRQAVEGILHEVSGISRSKKVEVVAAVDARGFIFGAIVAYRWKLPFIPIRKAGKLPAETYEASYTLEYGKATMEMHKDAIHQGQNVFLVDDVLATGGTAAAAINLVEQAGGHVVGFSFLIELLGLGGRDKLSGYNIHSQMTF